MSSAYMVDPGTVKPKKDKAPLYFDVDAEETKGAFRLSILFVFAGMVTLGVDLSNVAASTDQIISLADVDDDGIWTYVNHVHLVMDKCELLLIEDTEMWKNDGRLTSEPYIRVQVPLDDLITIHVSKTGLIGSSRSIHIHVENGRLPAYAKYERFFCVMEWHYPQGTKLPTTDLQMTGRHVSTVTAGRCEVCALATMVGSPAGCAQPMPFIGNEADGTCTTAPAWGEGENLNIWTEKGHTTPMIVGLRNADIYNLTVDSRGSGYIEVTGAKIGAPGAHVTLTGSASANIEVTHAIRADLHQHSATPRICSTDVSLVVDEDVVVEETNVTNITVASEGTTDGTETTDTAETETGTDTAAADPLAALLAALLGAGAGGGATTAAAGAGASAGAGTTTETAGTPPAEAIDESEIEDLGRRRLQLVQDTAALLQADERTRRAVRRRLTETSGGAGDGAGDAGTGETGAFNMSNTSNDSVVMVNTTNATVAEEEIPLLDSSVLPIVFVDAARGVVSVRGERDNQERPLFVAVYVPVCPFSLFHLHLPAVGTIAGRGTAGYEGYVTHQSYFNALYGVVISDSDISRLKRIFTQTEPVADIVNLRLHGRGAPYGTWKWHRDSLYSGYSPVFLSSSSLGLLAPRGTTIDVTLERAFCNEDDADDQQDTSGSISTTTEVALLKLHAVLAREIGKLALEVDDRSYGGLPSASTPIGFRAWGADRFGVVTVGVDHRVGVLYLAALSYGMTDMKITAGLVANLNLFVVFVVGVYLGLKLIYGYIARWRAHLKVWGSSYFGPKWRSSRRWPRVREQAGFFFMMEFLVAYPRGRVGMRNRILTVVVDFCSIIVPALPILFVLVVSRHAYEGPMKMFTAFGAVLVLLLTIFGMFYLACNYLGLRWSLRMHLRKPFFILLSAAILTSSIICVNLYWWLLVGASLRPSVLLPAATAATNMLFHLVLATRRMRALAAQLPSELARASATTAAVNAAMEALEEGVQQWHRKRAVKDASDTLGPLRVLEITGDAHRAVLHTEMLWALFFTVMAMPIVAAHRGYAYHLKFAEAAVASLAITMVMICLQLARPLVDGGLVGQQHAWEAVVTRTAAEEEAQLARLEAETAAAAMLDGSSEESSDVSDLDGSFDDDPPGMVNRGYGQTGDGNRKSGSAGGKARSGARKRRVAPSR